MGKIVFHQFYPLSVFLAVIHEAAARAAEAFFIAAENEKAAAKAAADVVV
jgi:hypothetical protein